MWSPVPAFPRRHLIAQKWILYFLGASGIFYLPWDSDHARYTDKTLWHTLYNIYFVIATSCTITVTIFTGVDFLHVLNDVDVFADRGVVFATLSMVLIKQNVLTSNKRRIEVWVADIQRRHLKANKIESVRFAENDKATFYQVKIFAGLWLLVVASFLLPLYLERQKDFDLPSVKAPLLNVDSKLKYAIFYTWNTVALTFSMSRLFGSDLFMIGMYSHASSRLEALGDALEKIGHDNESSRRVSVGRFIKKSVLEHNDIVKFVEELNHVYYWPLLVHYVFVAGTVAGCGLLALVSILHGNISGFVNSATYVIGIVCETWVYCKFGDRLKSASFHVFEALWKCDWYKLSKEDRRSILLIMRVSEKTLYMGAGNIFQLDRVSLGSILKSSYSYFTVLRKIYS